VALGKPRGRRPVLGSGRPAPRAVFIWPLAVDGFVPAILEGGVPRASDETMPGRNVRLARLNPTNHTPLLPGAIDGWRPRSRWGAIDSARGAAMAFVCLSHFGSTYFAESDPRARWLQWIGMIATPTFVILSGIVVGDRMGGAAARLSGNRRWLVDRGLFLIVAGHPLIFLALVANGAGSPLRWVFVTDVIGLCLLLAPLFLRLRPPWRVAGGLAILAVNWAIVPLRPAPGWPLALKEFLVGALVLREFEHVFPVLPWLGVFLVATALGERVANVRRTGDAAVARFVWRMAFAALGAAAIARAAALFPRHPALVWLAHLKKLPPSPVYVAFFAGAGLVMLAAFIELERHDRLPTLRGVAALIGRNSLVVFIAQFYVYFTATVLLHPPVSDAWPIWFLVSLAPVLAVALVSDRVGANRHFTVGLRAPARKVP
jgi:uncharacterized membrane protein